MSLVLSIFEICVPREKGTIASADFAANFAKVIRGIASDYYQKPDHFLANTYPTQGFKNLRNVVEDIGQMGKEEAAYWRGMAMHRKKQRRILSALRIFLTTARRRKPISVHV
jgi:hypothetical protein